MPKAGAKHELLFNKLASAALASPIRLFIIIIVVKFIDYIKLYLRYLKNRNGYGK
jgi:hypothetical protein